MEGAKRRTTGKLYRSGNHQDLSERRSGSQISCTITGIRMPEIDLILGGTKTVSHRDQKMASPPKKLTKVFDLIDKSPLQRGTGAILCMADQLGAF